MKISLLHPSRGRPVKSFETLNKWVNKAGTLELQCVVSIDSDDSKISDYSHMYGPMNYTGSLIVNNNRSAVDAINNAAKVSNGDILIVVSDDTDCPDNWAVSLIKEVQEKKDWILKTQDGIQKWIITMPVMDRAYYNRFGYIYHPDYKHMFCDTELTCVADLTGRKLTSNLLFPHNHYSINKNVKDQVSERADATWAEGERLFIDRYKKNFGLVNYSGKIESQEYLNWIKRKI